MPTPVSNSLFPFPFVEDGNEEKVGRLGSKCSPQWSERDEGRRYILGVSKNLFLERKKKKKYTYRYTLTLPIRAWEGGRSGLIFPMIIIIILNPKKRLFIYRTERKRKAIVW